MDSAEPAEPSELQPLAGGRRRRTLWGAGVAVVVVGFVVLVVTSTQRAAVPVDASGGMGGMQMQGMEGGGSGMQMSLRDIDGRVLRVPNGRPGVAVFIAPRNCAVCIEAVRAAAGPSGERGRRRS